MFTLIFLNSNEMLFYTLIKVLCDKKIHDNTLNYYIMTNKIYLYNYTDKITCMIIIYKIKIII